jgi:hypothetical protein
MTTAAWIFMLAVWSVIIGNTGYCFWKLLSSERQFGGGDES